MIDKETKMVCRYLWIPSDVNSNFNMNIKNR